MRRWLVTGAGSGIGRAVAELAAEAGDAVALVGRRDLGEVAAAVEKAGGTAVPIQADLAAPDGPESVAAAAVAGLGGPVDALVNSAALHVGGRLASLSDEDYRAVLEIGLVSPFRLIRTVAAGMERGGAVVNIGAVVGLRGFPGDSPWLGQGGLAGLTKVLGVELARDGITVNLVVPGFTDSEMTEGVDEVARERIVRGIPLRRTAAPIEIARVVHWVADTPYMTGAVIPVDGGLMAGFGTH